MERAFGLVSPHIAGGADQTVALLDIGSTMTTLSVLHDGKTIYLGGNVVFKSTDEGLTWEVISPDLTNNIKERQKITGTPWLSEYFGQEIYSTIKRLDESPVQQGVIWTGSDDGKIFIEDFIECFRFFNFGDRVPYFFGKFLVFLDKLM